MVGQEQTPWNALFSAIADTFFEMSGSLLTRISKTGGHLVGDPDLEVESTDRFPDSGRVVVNNTIMFYASKTTVLLETITDVDGNAGIPIEIPDRMVVADISRDSTQMDDLRASFIVTTAEGVELDILGRNYGLTRPRGLPDSDWRFILQALIYIEAQTMYALEQVLDLLWPLGYTLYEDLESFPHTVFVGIPAAGSDSSVGKTWLVGGEEQPQTGANTVDVDNPPRLVYGVYLDTDVNRTGTNYANETLATSSNTAAPQTLTTAALWVASDLGKPVVIDTFAAADQHWKIGTYTDTSNVDLRWATQTDGTTNGIAPLRFVTDTAWFPAWVATTATELVIETGANAGSYPVTDRISATELELASGVFVTDTDVEWHLRPVLPTSSPDTAVIPRATFSSLTITTPQALPADVLVDYTHVPSAQMVVNPSTSGVDQYPFYLWDAGAITQALLDLITAAGVQVVIVLEP